MVPPTIGRVILLLFSATSMLAMSAFAAWLFWPARPPQLSGDKDVLDTVDALFTAVRSQDDRPVSIGLLPLTTGPFAPANIADLLDMLIIHEYPTTGQAPAAVSLIKSFATFEKPVLLGETFMLSDDGPTQSAFLTQAAPYLTGAFEFFNGRDPNTLQPHTIYDAIYQTSLQQFITLRHTLLTT